VRAIISVAEKAGVRLALHPNDPPGSGALGGIPGLIYSFVSYKRAFETADSPALGMGSCCGCWLEGREAFGDNFEGIRAFGEENRILIVH
jgi:mannonate dehydratase